MEGGGNEDMMMMMGMDMDMMEGGDDK